MTTDNQTNSPLSELIRQRGIRPHTIVNFPGEENDKGDALQVALVSLTDFELHTCRVGALKFLRETMKLDEFVLSTELGNSMLEVEIQVQVLYHSMRAVDNVNNKMFCASVSELRAFLEPDTRNALWAEYVAFQHARNPLKAIDSKEKLDDLIGALKNESRSTNADMLSYLDSATLRSTVRELVSRLKMLTKSNS